MNEFYMKFVHSLDELLDDSDDEQALMLSL